MRDVPETPLITTKRDARRRCIERVLQWVDENCPSYNYNSDPQEGLDNVWMDVIDPFLDETCGGCFKSKCVPFEEEKGYVYNEEGIAFDANGNEVDDGNEVIEFDESGTYAEMEDRYLPDNSPEPRDPDDEPREIRDPWNRDEL